MNILFPFITIFILIIGIAILPINKIVYSLNIETEKKSNKTNSTYENNTTTLLNHVINSSSSNKSLYIKNPTGFASFIGKVNVKDLPSITMANMTNEEKNRGSYDNVFSENYSKYAIKNESSYFVKSEPKLIAISPPTIKSNISSFTTSLGSQSSNNSSPIIVSSNHSVNSSDISHNTSGLGRQIMGFYGLNWTNTCERCLPPDVSIAVGPNKVIETITGAIGFWTKEGSYIYMKDINDFFKINGSDITADPNIIYDQSSNRWFASILDVNKSSVRVAVSNNMDPTIGDWNIQEFYADGCPDLPKIGSSNDKIVVSFNQLNVKCLPKNEDSYPSTVGLVIIDKNDLINGSLTPKFYIINNKDIPALVSLPSLFPVKLIDSQSNMRLVSVGTSNNPTIQIFTIESKVKDIFNFTNIYRPINRTQMPPKAIQPNSDILLDTGNARVMDATYYQGKVWLVFNNSCDNTTDKSRSCIRIMSVDLQSSRVLYDRNIGYNSSYYMYPALTIDGNGNLVVIFSYSSKTIFPSIAIFEQMPAGNDSISKVLLKEGTKANEQGDETIGNNIKYEKCVPGTETQCSRFGDYFGAARDPSDPSVVWVAGEYYSEPTFSTFIAKLSGHN